MKPPPATIPVPAPSKADFDHEAVAADLEDRSASDVIAWALETFGESHYFACSFQKTSAVMLDLATRVNPGARFFYLDTDVLFPETYETRDRLEDHFGIEFDRFHNITIEEQAELYGSELWRRDSDACCGLRKVEPMRRALSGVDVWGGGVRRGDSASRANTPKLAWDKKFGLWKVNPLADWSEADVWNHIHDNGLPYNPLHDRGYPSIGCTHCTQPVGPGGSPRDGRWVGSSKTECGIN